MLLQLLDVHLNLIMPRTPRMLVPRALDFLLVAAEAEPMVLLHATKPEELAEEAKEDLIIQVHGLLHQFIMETQALPIVAAVAEAQVHPVEMLVELVVQEWFSLKD